MIRYNSLLECSVSSRNNISRYSVSTLLMLKWWIIYPKACSGSSVICWIWSYSFRSAWSRFVMTLFNCMYEFGNSWGNGNRILRNVNSLLEKTRIICFLSDSSSDPEWYSKFDCNDSSSETWSEDCDMASNQGSGKWAGVSGLFVPLIFVLVEFQIRDAVNRKGETILAQVHCLRYDQGYHQWPLLATTELWGSEY